MGAIFLHQLHDNLRSLRFQASLVVLLLFFVGNGVVYTYKMDRVAKETAHTARGDEGRYEDVETLRQAVAKSYKIRAAESGSEFIIEAGSNWFPYGLEVSAETGSVRNLSHARTTNYWMRNFEVLDWSVIVRYVVSFLCIVLSYNAISGEREGGTLRLALANPLSRAHFLAGKFLAHFATLMVTLAVGSLVSVAILALNRVLSLDGLLARNYLFFLAIAAFYIALFLLLGMGISALARTSATSLIVLILSWAALIVVIPQTSYLIAVKVVESSGLWWERMGEQETQYREAMDADGVALRQPDLARTDGYALERRYADRLRDMEGELDGIMRDVEATDLRQFSVARSVNLLSPGFAFQYGVEALLGTGIHRFQSFAAQARQYRVALREFLRGRDAADADSPHVLFIPEFMSDRALDPGDIPRFRLQPLTLGDSLDAAAVPITILVLEAALAFFFALRAMNRTELTD